MFNRVLFRKRRENNQYLKIRTVSAQTILYTYTHMHMHTLTLHLETDWTTEELMCIGWQHNDWQYVHVGNIFLNNNESSKLILINQIRVEFHYFFPVLYLSFVQLRTIRWVSLSCSYRNTSEASISIHVDRVTWKMTGIQRINGQNKMDYN